MCFGGGGDDRASTEAQKAEDARKLQVTNATSAIDKAFAGRDSQIDDFSAALRSDFLRDAKEQKTVADRRLKFSLARGGLTGGSAASDSGRTLAKDFQKGLLKGERGVQSSVGNLRSADESTRQNLVSLAQGGAGVSSSAQAAANAMRANIASAKSTGLASDIGDIFTNTRGLFVKQEEAAARRRGLAESEVFADPFSN